MYSKILARWEEIARFTTEDLTRDLESTIKNTAALTDPSVFEDMLSRRNKLHAYAYVIKHFREVLKINGELQNVSTEDVVKMTHVQMLETVTREVVNQSTNIRLDNNYKNALLDMLRDLQFSVPK